MSFCIRLHSMFHNYSQYVKCVQYLLKECRKLRMILSMKKLWPL